MIIHLEHSLPDVSRALPEYKHENLLCQMAQYSYLDLLPVGFTFAISVTAYAVSSYHTFSPLPIK